MAMHNAVLLHEENSLKMLDENENVNSVRLSSKLEVL